MHLHKKLSIIYRPEFGFNKKVSILIVDELYRLTSSRIRCIDHLISHQYYAILASKTIRWFLVLGILLMLYGWRTSSITWIWKIKAYSIHHYTLREESVKGSGSYLGARIEDLQANDTWIRWSNQGNVINDLYWLYQITYFQPRAGAQ